MNEREDDKKAVRAELSDFMEEIRRDGKAGLAAFYERYKNMILRTALSVCRSLAVAEDVLDDVLIILIKVWKTAENSKGKGLTEGWLYVITVGGNKQAIEKYIQNQEKEDVISAQISMVEYYDPFEKWLKSHTTKKDNSRRK